METTIEKHKSMVLRLAKPGEAILESLTPLDCDFVHMGGCLGGEAAELFDAVLVHLNSPSPGTDNLLEELGDFAFYLVKCSTFFSRDWHGRVSQITAPTVNCVELMRLGGHYWDVVKRVTVYRKPIDKPDSKHGGKTLTSVAVSLLDQMEERFNALVTFYNFDLETVLEANYQKLADADKGRFSSGTYSDAQAQNRQDKKEPEEIPHVTYDESVNNHITAKKRY